MKPSGWSAEPWSDGLPGARSAWIAGLHLTALISFAVAQPLYDVIGRDADFLVAHGAGALTIVTLVLVLSVLLPMSLLAIEALAARVARRAALWLHRGLVALLLAAVALYAMKRSAPLPGWPLVGLAGALGVSGAASYVRRARLRALFTLLSAAAWVFPVYFLFATPVASLLKSAPAPVSDVRIDSMTPVVVVILDELSTFSIMDESQRIDALRYPHLAALAATATWFRNATTVAQSTGYAVPAILSGRYPDQRRLATASYYPFTLLTLLGTSYDLRVFETQTSLCPKNLCTSRPRRPFVERIEALLLDLYFVYPRLLVPADVAQRLHWISATWRDFGGRQQAGDDGGRGKARRRSGRLAQFARFLEALRSGHDATLYLIHLELPHLPWKFLPSGKSYGPVPMPTRPHGLRPDSDHWQDDEWPIVQAFQRYLLQVGYVDRLIGELIATLKEAGLYESSLLIVVADHGISFRPGDRRRVVTQSNFADIASVPLLVKLPEQQRGAISDRNVQTIDVLPTIADVLDLEIPWEVDGRSAIDDSLPTSSEKRIFPSNRTPGNPFVFNREHLAMRRQSLEWMSRIFGSRDGSDGRFRIGPRPDLLGSRVRDQAVADGARLRLVLGGAPERVGQYDPRSAFAPTHLSGRIVGQGAGDAPLELAIAVNGYIRAVTRTFSGEEARFTAMVAESAFRPGTNQIEVFAISEVGGRIRLEPAASG